MKTITVTAEHIKKGTPKCANECPIALAIYDETGAKDVSVGAQFVRIDREEFELPKVARTFVEDFDASKDDDFTVYFEVKPITFELGEPISEEQAKELYTFGNALEV